MRDLAHGVAGGRLADPYWQFRPYLALFDQLLANAGAQLAHIRDLFSRAGMDAATSTTDELAAVVNKDYPRWGEVIRAAGVRAE